MVRRFDGSTGQWMRDRGGEGGAGRAALNCWSVENISTICMSAPHKRICQPSIELFFFPFFATSFRAGSVLIEGSRACGVWPTTATTNKRQLTSSSKRGRESGRVAWPGLNFMANELCALSWWQAEPQSVTQSVSHSVNQLVNPAIEA